MRPGFSFHLRAEDELNEAAAYYEAESAGLGSAFLDAVAKAVEDVLEYPQSAPLVNRWVRKKVIRRFPYNVLYSITTAGIRILAVANQKRRPFYWRGRR